MIAILINILSVLAGSLLGAVAHSRIREKYFTVLNTAMGLAALVLGMSVAMQNMTRSEAPVLFLVSLVLGGLIGTALQLDLRVSKVTQGGSGSGHRLSEGILTATLLCCVGTLSMMGPVMSALYGDNMYLYTVAVLNFVTMVIVASSYGIAVSVTALIVAVWMYGIYGITLLSRDFISQELVNEMSLVGGILIAGTGLGVLNIKDCKTLNLLPAIFVPMVYFWLRSVFGW